ncbi:EAL domain-containing protein [Shewanella sp. Isolate11]|uniref:putative bifunctional diguanylate cyclase/phosphodiesterase n=1 Tax=Shewanella sp. Isolate11 TaxID=2908530 RepID=UPI001EFDA273|nr:EAL domain-containing protein [Shewanella sp. Isolate11]MCG9698255.1 EAL domain-containing protein [Shewanella sp. Isolate11]
MRISKKIVVFVVGFCLPAILGASYSLSVWFDNRIDELKHAAIEAELLNVKRLVGNDLHQLASLNRIHSLAIDGANSNSRERFESSWLTGEGDENIAVFSLQDKKTTAYVQPSSDFNFSQLPDELFNVTQPTTGFVSLAQGDFMVSVNPISATESIVLVRKVDNELLARYQVNDFIYQMELKTGTLGRDLMVDDHNLTGMFNVPGVIGGSELHLFVSIIETAFSEVEQHSAVAIYLIWGLSLLLLLLGYSWLKLSIVRPFKLILKQLAAIDPTAKTYKPLQGYGCSELRVFADQVNALLARIFRQKERSKTTLEAIVEAVILTDAWAKVVYLNPRAERLLKISSQQAVGMPISQLFKSDNSINDTLFAMMVADEMQPLTDKVKFTAHEPKIMERNISNLRNPQQKVIGNVIVLRDITQEELLKHQLRRRANYDPVTSLLNRCAFEERLTDFSQQADIITLCYFDLEQFKLINDSCGHNAGDRMLKLVARAIQGCVEDHYYLLARLGGDEFGLALKNQAITELAPFVQRIIDNVAMQVIEADGSHYKVGCSVGVAVAQAPYIQEQELLKDAEIACIAAKQAGRNQIHFYDDKDNELNYQRNAPKWAMRITQAIEHNELLLYCQPIKGLAHDCGPKRFEVLLRIQEPGGRMLPPAQFIAAAERFKLMIEVDKEIIRKTFLWLSMHESFWDDHCFSINLSGNSLGAEGMVDYIAQQLARFGIPSRCICFEITETSAIQNRNRALSMLHQLRKQGFSFALDDFGTGFASYGYLRELPVNYVKIDGCFIKTLANSAKDYAIVKSIHDVCHVMGIETVAEFVENQAIIDRLESIGIDYAQGYAIGRPQSLEEYGNQVLQESRLMA